MDGKLKEIIAEVLGIPPSRVVDETSVETEGEWDSLRHMNLIFAIEDAFGVRFDDEEVARLTSVEMIEKSLATRR